MWTRETPTKEGWYWRRLETGFKYLGHFVRSEVGGVWFFDGYVGSIDDEHWSTPVAEPEEKE